MPLEPLGSALRRVRARRTADAILAAVRRPPPDPPVSSGGFDGSSLSCDCSCHIVYGAKHQRPSRRSSCDHCRVYG